tara:strand:+ start:1237 stop:1605 length:369 start_codon:yes stop_codon:yes gene_type:complete
MNNISPEAAALINHVFKSLCGAKPSWRSGFKTNDDVSAYKEALALTFMENGITTPEQVHKGLAEVRRNENPFMPSTGEFLKWCKPERKMNINYTIASPVKEITEEDKSKYSSMSANLLEMLK